MENIVELHNVSKTFQGFSIEQLNLQIKKDL